MPSFDKKFSDLVDRVYATPEGKAYLRMIKACEGGEYDIIFGGEKITDLSKHPNKRIKFNDRAGGGVSTAAGAYQITNPTWNGMAPRIAANDFGQKNQDRVALALALEKPGMYEAIMSRNVPKMVEGSNGIYTSLPGSKEGGRRHALTTMEYAQAAYDDKLKDYKGPRWSDKGTKFSGVQSTLNTQQPVSSQTYSFGQEAINSNPNYQGSFFLNAMNDIMNKSYANTGNIPFEVMNSNIGNRTVFGAIDEDPQSLVDKLFDTDPNTTYGLSYVGSSLRPTVSRLNPDGNRVNMIEFPNGTYINAATGERMNADGTVYEGTPVEYLTPDYEAPQNSPEAMAALREGNIRQAAPLTDMENEQAIVPVQSVADPGNAITGEYNYQGTTAEATLPAGNTPLTTQPGSVASPVAYVNPNDALVAVLGGDAVTRTLNSTRPAIDNARDLMRLA